MERGIFKLIRGFFWLVLISIQIYATADDSDDRGRELVLVTLKNSPIENLNSRDVRRIFLGVPLESNKVSIIPIRNTSDSLLYQIFLQKVVYLSARDYERQLISRAFRKGGNRPAEIEEAHKLVNTLRSNPGAVTFMWADTASKYQDLKVVKSLWKGSVQ